MSLNFAFLHQAEAPRQSRRQIWPTVSPIEVIRAHSIAHQQMTPTLRADHAAGWIAGRVLMIPTAKLACETFGVSYPTVLQATEASKHRPNSSMPLGLLTYGWLNCSELERVAFCEEFESDVWAALERVADLSH